MSSRAFWRKTASNPIGLLTVDLIRRLVELDDWTVLQSALPSVPPFLTVEPLNLLLLNPFSPCVSTAFGQEWKNSSFTSLTQPGTFLSPRLCNLSHQIRIIASCGEIIQELKGMKVPLSREGLRGTVLVFILLSSLLSSSLSSPSSLHHRPSFIPSSLGAAVAVPGSSGRCRCGSVDVDHI